MKLWLSYSIIPLKTELIFLIIFDILWLLVSSYEWTATVCVYFFQLGKTDQETDHLQTKMWQAKMQNSTLWRLFSSVQSLSSVSTQWSRITMSSSFQPSFPNLKFKGRNTTGWLLEKAGKPVPSVTGTDSGHTKLEGSSTLCSSVMMAWIPAPAPHDLFH